MVCRATRHAARLFHLDHFRAEIAQHGSAERTRNQGADVEDAYAVEGEGIAHTGLFLSLFAGVRVKIAFPRKSPAFEVISARSCLRSL